MLVLPVFQKDTTYAVTGLAACGAGNRETDVKVFIVYCQTSLVDRRIKRPNSGIKD